MALTIDELNIEISSNAEQASKNMDKLTSALDRLGNATAKAASLSSVVKALNNLGGAANSLSRVDFKSFGANIANLSKALLPLNQIQGKLGETIKSLGKVASISDQLNTVDYKQFAGNITTLTTALTPLANINSRLGGTLGQLRQLGTISRELNTTMQSDTFSSNISKISTALNGLGNIGKNNLRSVLTQIRKIPEISKELEAMDVDKFTAQINRLAAALGPLATECNAISSGFARLPQRTRQVITAFDQVTNRANKTGKSISGLTTRLSMTIGKMWVMYMALKRIADGIAACFNESNSYIETLNLFCVTMGKAADEAYAFAEKVQDAMGIDIAEWMQNQGVFQNLITGFGVATGKADIMSKNLTQLSYDLASFFNTSTEVAADKLQSAMAGQVKGLREFGIETTVAAMQEYALSKGITQSVRSMTMAQKTLLRYNLIMEKSILMQGDMGRTLITPANALRILNAQMTQFKRAIGNIVSVLATRLIPYVQALVRMATRAANSLANMFGFELPKIDYSDLGLSTAFSDAEEEADGVLGTVNKIKKQLMGFDEINLLNKPDSGSGASSSAFSSGWTMDLHEYDFLKGLDKQDLSKYEERIKKIAIAIGLVGAALLTWKFATNFATGLNAIRGLFGGSGVPAVIGAGSAGKMKIPGVKSVLKGMADIGIIIGGAVALVAAMGLLMKIPGAEKTVKEGTKLLGIVFKGLWNIALPLALTSAATVILGRIGIPTIVKGFADMSIIIGGAAILITAIGALMSIPHFKNFLSTGIQSVKGVFNGLWEVAVPIGVLSAYMVVAGLLSPTVFLSGLAGFALVIGGTAVLITAIGALMSIPGFNGFLSTGVESVKKMFNGLWDVAVPIGALSVLMITLGIATPAVILSGLAGFTLIIGGVTVLLVALGALNQIPGFDWIIGEGGSVLAKLGNILGQFIGSIVGGIGEGISASLPKIGKDLSDFMGSAKPFFDGVKNINSDAVNSVGFLATSVLALTASNVLEGLTSWFAGKRDFVSFGKQLSEFAPYFVDYYKKIKEVKGEVILASSNAAKSIVEFANNIPNSGGVAAWFAGDNNINKFGKMLPGFGKNFKEYYGYIKGIDGAAITGSSNAAKAIAEMANKIPNSGGFFAKFSGDNDISKFGEMLPSFGRNFKSYYDYIKDIKDIPGLSNMFNSLISFATKVKNDVDIGAFKKFSDAVKKLGENLSNLPGKKTIGLDVTYSTRVEDNKKKIYQALGLPGYPSLKWRAYKNGGFPDAGEMFFANEDGPELVGRIGNKTAVANQDQIVKAVAQGVASAVSSVMRGNGNSNGNVNIHVSVPMDKKVIGEAFVQYHNGQVKQTGRSPLIV